jgi:hypothetical protein
MIELRAQQILIETPRIGAEPFMSIVIQRVVFGADGNIIQTINREKRLISSLSKKMLETYPLHDPVPTPEKHISVAGVGFCIEQIVRAWILETYPESYLKDDRVLIDDHNK